MCAQESDRLKKTARELIREFKGDNYVFGLECLDRAGALASQLGRRAALVAGGSGKEWGARLTGQVLESLRANGLAVGEVIPGAKPNSPYDDVFRIADAISAQGPDVVVALGGGSVIDAVKASLVLVAFGGRTNTGLERFFGVGKVADAVAQKGKTLIPMMAVQVASGSAAHLTRYSNITDPATFQKKLIIDDLQTPKRALFDYTTSVTMSRDFTADGALDGFAHALEVFFGVKGAGLEKIRLIALTAIELIVKNVRAARECGGDLDAREALGLGTDLGGYAIMTGGTSGGHLTSFSFVDILPHGRACALMNPYYTVFYAPAIQSQLVDVAAILHAAGYLKTDSYRRLKGRELGIEVAGGMIELAREVGFPTRLADVPGFGDEHIRRALAAAKNPQLESKLRNMPVPLTADTVDDFMGPVLEAARTGDFSLIK